jgi:3',5'-cyclic AMP phosphodiesterase CpdA
MFTLAQLSDVHLAPLPAPRLHELMTKRAFGYLNWQRRRFQHQREVLDRLVADMLAQEPDHVAVTGDLVNIALPAEFIQARRWLEGLGGPDAITVIPGNHDAYVPFFRNPGVRQWLPYMLPNEAGERFERSKSGFPFVRLFGEIALICLSSARPTIPGLASGWLGWRQISRLGPILDTLGREGLCRVVLIHHPPLPGMTPWQRALHDAGAMRKVLMQHGAELVLHGHNHRAMYEVLETASGPAPIVGAPSASLSSEDPAKHAGYNLFRIARGGNGNWRIGRMFRVFDASGRPIDSHQDLLP